MTSFALRRWAPRHLLLAWCGYWLALVVAVLGLPAFMVWRLTHDPGRHGGVQAGLTNDVVALTVTENGAVRWAGSTTLLVIALWFALPPLLLFVAWWRARPVHDAHPPAGTAGERAAPLLGGARVPGSAAGPARTTPVGGSERVRSE
ncbi:hypothetical protein tb265_26530 [Gemmatimonadetes bacterium T265]|nr:hypothetical protein tb265_26530 [Gemmatimonadetes bacterium T265]